MLGIWVALYCRAGQTSRDHQILLLSLSGAEAQSNLPNKSEPFPKLDSQNKRWPLENAPVFLPSPRPQSLPHSVKMSHAAGCMQGPSVEAERDSEGHERRSCSCARVHTHACTHTRTHTRTHKSTSSPICLKSSAIPPTYLGVIHSLTE